eukprot:jgi/Botrbrau1/19121/Bobra.0077s0034.1
MDVKSLNSSMNSNMGRGVSTLSSPRLARVAPVPSRRVAVWRKANYQHGTVIAQQLESKSISVSNGSSAEPKLTHTHSVKLKTPRVAVFSSANYVKNFFEAVLQAACPGSSFFEARLDKDSAALAAGHDVVCLFVNDDASAEVIEELASVGVKMIAMRCAGFDKVDLVAAEKWGIQVARVPTYSPHSVAEHAVGLCLCLNRNLHKAYVRIWQGDYSLSGLVGFEIRTKTIGILGTGAIGAATAQIFKGFGGKVIAYDIRENPAVTALGIPYVSKEEVLQEADIVSLHVPLLPSTYHIIDRNSIAMMKDGAMIINVSRGALVDTDAAIEALESAKLGGLAIDVYEHEGALFFSNWSAMPFSDRASTWDRRFQVLKSLPTVLVSPHSAFLTKEALDNIAATTIYNISQFAAGEELTNAVKAQAK